VFTRFTQVVRPPNDCLVTDPGLLAHVLVINKYAITCHQSECLNAMDRYRPFNTGGLGR
jgi:hypothetical protein